MLPHHLLHTWHNDYYYPVHNEDFILRGFQTHLVATGHSKFTELDRNNNDATPDSDKTI